MKNIRSGLFLLIAVSVFQVTADDFDELLNMSEQLDMLDSMDFTEHINKADACVRQRDFICAERELASARKLANGGEDDYRLHLTATNLAAEQQLVYAEQQDYERERYEAEERERIAREEQEKQYEEPWCNPNRPNVCGGGGQPTTFDNGYEQYEEAASDYNPGVAEYMDAAQQDLGEFINNQNNNMNDMMAWANENERRQERERENEQRRQQAEQDRRDREYERDQENERRQQAEYDRREREQERQRLAELDRQRADDLRRQQEADRQRQRELDREAALQAKTDYLNRLAAGARLKAMNCYGEQHVLGVLPDIKPAPVSCINVNFRAYCPGNTSNTYTGTMTAMQSNTGGCFGDTAQITSPLACAAEEIRVDVAQIIACP